MSYELDAKKFAWAILIKDGVPFAKWEHYANGFVSVPPEEIQMRLFGDTKSWYRLEYMEKILEYVERLRLVPVDWEKTEEPAEETHQGFVGTFAPSSRTSCLEGTLVLKDGTEIPYGAEVSNDDLSFMELAKRAMKARDLIKEVFGDE